MWSSSASARWAPRSPALLAATRRAYDRRSIATTDIYPLPRAVHVDHEIMRILQELGCADEMLAEHAPEPGHGLPDRRPPGAAVDALAGRHRARAGRRRCSSTNPVRGASSRTAVAGLGAGDRLGSGVAAIETVDADERDPTTCGSRSTTAPLLTARYVVGCDGARSFTRRSARHRRCTTSQFEEPWLVVDLVLDDPVASRCPDVRTAGVRSGTPAHAGADARTAVPLRVHAAPRRRPGRRCRRPRWCAELTAGWLPDGAADLERVRGLHVPRTRSPPSGEPVGCCSPVTPRTRCRRSSGRACAAACATRPTWRGSCDAVLARRPDESLLDTYQAEREPHVRSIVDAAVGFGRIICTLDAPRRRQRDEAMLAARNAAARRTAHERVAFRCHRSTGPLVTSGGGRPSFQPVVDGQRLDDLVGPRWLVVILRHGSVAARRRTWWLAAWCAPC